MPQDAAQPGELREDDDFTTALYRAAIGPVNTDYYLTLFSTWDQFSPFKPRWNSAAGLWTLGWMVFRKMGGASVAYVGALMGSALLIFGVGRLFINLSETGQIIMFLLWLLIAVLIPGLWGNVWFHNHCRKRMALALTAHTEVAESCAALARQSSQPRRALAVGTVQVGMLVALGLGALQFSALMQRAGLHLPGAANVTPQMASGKVKDMPATPVSAPAVVAASSPSARVSAPITVASAPTSIASATTSVATAAKPAVSAPAPTTPAPAVAAKPLARAVPAVAASTVAAGAFGVNVGLFAKEANAQSAKAKLEAAKLPVMLDTLQMKRGPRFRVRVGPFASKVEADKAAASVRSLGLEAVTYPN